MICAFWMEAPKGVERGWGYGCGLGGGISVKVVGGGESGSGSWNWSGRVVCSMVERVCSLLANGRGGWDLRSGLLTGRRRGLGYVVDGDMRMRRIGRRRGMVRGLHGWTEVSQAN